MCPLMTYRQWVNTCSINTQNSTWWVEIYTKSMKVIDADQVNDYEYKIQPLWNAKSEFSRKHFLFTIEHLSVDIWWLDKTKTNCRELWIQMSFVTSMI